MLSGVRAGNDATWPVTQVVLRPVKAGLGGHDAGVSGDDEGVEDAPISLWKRGRIVLTESPTFSVFVPAPKDIFSEDQNQKNTTIELCCIHDIVCQDSRLVVVKLNNILGFDETRIDQFR